jgi:hypothetical protein
VVGRRQPRGGSGSTPGDGREDGRIGPSGQRSAGTGRGSIVRIKNDDIPLAALQIFGRDELIFDSAHT